jgi:hypothetical protein
MKHDTRGGAAAPRAAQQQGAEAEQHAPPLNGGPASPGNWRDTHVTKTLRPPQGGTLRHSTQHGGQLVCVRYRQAANSLYRCTTVELVVDSAAVDSHRARKQRLHAAIAFDELALRAAAKRLGAKWIPECKVWELWGAATRRLDLNRRARRPAPKSP